MAADSSSEKPSDENAPADPSDTATSSEIDRHISIEDLAPHFPTLILDSFLADGGMGAVYRAKQRELDREIALKLISHEWSEHGKELDMFRKEARLMARLSHPNLVQIFDFGSIDDLGIIYFLMEYVHGETLHSYIFRTRLTHEQSVALMKEVGIAIVHAHAEGVWHHDIKPGNIMLTPEGKVKVLDFGLAKLANETIAAEGERFGTPDYAAPEVYYEGESPDHRSDIFSLGAVFYELLTGDPPGNDPKPPSQVAGISPRHDAFLMRSLAHNPKKRFQSVEEWLAALSAPDAQRVSTSPPPLPHLQSTLKRGVRPGTIHPSVKRLAKRPPRGPVNPGPLPALQPTRLPPTVVAPRGVQLGGGPEALSAPKEPMPTGWIVPVILLLGLGGTGIWYLSDRVKNQGREARLSGREAAATAPAATVPNKSDEATSTKETISPGQIEPQPGATLATASLQPTAPASPSENAAGEISLGGPPSTSITITPKANLDSSLPQLASLSSHGTSLKGALDQEKTLGVDLTKEAFTLKLSIEMPRAITGQAIAIADLGGYESGLGLFVAEVNGASQVLLSGGGSHGANFALVQPIPEGTRVVLTATHSPAPDGATLSLQLDDRAPFTKKTDIPAWIDGDLANGFGPGVGRRASEMGGGSVFHGPPFGFPQTPSPFKPYTGELDYRLLRGVEN